MNIPNCPVCGRTLSHGIPRSYETLNDHIIDPEGVSPIPYRPTLICTNERCQTFCNGFWSIPEHGQWYPFGKCTVSHIPMLSTSFYLSELERNSEYTEQGVYTGPIEEFNSDEIDDIERFLTEKQEKSNN